VDRKRGAHRLAERDRAIPEFAKHRHVLATPEQFDHPLKSSTCHQLATSLKVSMKAWRPAGVPVQGMVRSSSGLSNLSET
jgi:hypothetical protein